MPARDGSRFYCIEVLRKDAGFQRSGAMELRCSSSSVSIYGHGHSETCVKKSVRKSSSSIQRHRGAHLSSVTNHHLSFIPDCSGDPLYNGDTSHCHGAVVLRADAEVTRRKHYRSQRTAYIIVRIKRREQQKCRPPSTG
jgi:hypothetical protein